MPIRTNALDAHPAIVNPKKACIVPAAGSALRKHFIIFFVLDLSPYPEIQCHPSANMCILI